MTSAKNSVGSRDCYCPFVRAFRLVFNQGLIPSFSSGYLFSDATKSKITLVAAGVSEIRGTFFGGPLFEP